MTKLSDTLYQSFGPCGSSEFITCVLGTIHCNVWCSPALVGWLLSAAQCVWCRWDPWCTKPDWVTKNLTDVDNVLKCGAELWMMGIMCLNMELHYG